MISCKKTSLVLIILFYAFSIKAQTILNMASGINNYTDCDVLFYDNGGSGANYSNGFSGVTTFYPATSGGKVQLSFTSFFLEENFDFLYIYNGNSEAAPLLGTYTGKTIPSDFVATSPDGTITIKLTSDGGTNASGFAAIIKCVTPSCVKWTEKTSIPVAGEEATTFAIGDNIYVIGGWNRTTYNANVWKYNTLTDVWTQLTDFPGGNRSQGVGFSVGNKGYFGLGWDGTTNKKDWWEFDGTNWVSKTAYPGSASRGAVAFANGELGFVGMGWDGTTTFDAFYKYSPVTNTWTALTVSPKPTRYASGSCIGNNGYFSAGIWNNASQNTIYKYDISANTWTYMDDMCTATCYTDKGRAVALNGINYYLGGYYTTSSIFSYSPADGMWGSYSSIGTSLPRGAYSNSCVALKGKIYWGMGYDISDFSSSSRWYVADPTSYPIISSIIDTDISCNGFCDGLINTSTTAGYTPFSYSWSNSETTQNISGLCGGTYYVTVSDLLGCSKINSAFIFNPTAVTPTAGTDINLCLGNSANIGGSPTASGGTAGYSYLWNPTSGLSTANSANPLCTPTTNTTYVITVTDGNGCVSTDNISVTVNPLPTSSVSITEALCFGDANGIDITPIGGLSPFSYFWDNAVTTQDQNGLSSGTNYLALTLTDANACKEVSSHTITNATYAITTTPYSYSVSCYGSSDGEIQTNPFGGTGVLAYLWNNAATTDNISGLIAGNYSITITDDNACFFTEGYTVTEDILPTVVSVSVSSSSETTADIDGEVKCEGNVSVSDRGICYSTSPTPTTANFISSGGSGLGAYTSNLTGLTPGTMYYWRAYATNANGTAYDSYDNTFYTLSAEPTAHVTAFSASNPTHNTIDLSWTQEASANGYLIIQKGGGASTFVPVDGQSYSSGQTVGDGQVVADVGAVSTVTAATLNSLTNYYFTIYPYYFDGSNSQTINYYINPTVPVTNETTLDGVPNYCSSIGGSGSTEVDISNVTLDGELTGDINNGSVGCNESYGNYSTQVADVIKGSTYNFDFAPNYCGGMGSAPYGAAVFADWNKDGDFDDAGEKIITYDGTLIGAITISDSFTVPAGASTGLVGLRVITDYNVSSSSITPCMTGHPGETEDYGLNVNSFTCLVNGSSGTNGYLKNVSLHTLNRASTFDGYAYASETTTLETGENYSLAIDGNNTSGTGGWTAAWIDWNNDGDFDDVNEDVVTPLKDVTVGDFSRNVGVSIPGGTTVPATVTMRVVWKDGNEIATTSCDVYNTNIDWEDYQISLKDPCVIVSDFVTNNLCFAQTQGSVDLTVTGIPSAFQEQIGFGTASNSTTTYPAPYGNYYWGAKHQFLIKASEITQVNGDIGSLAFNVLSAQSAPLTDFTIRMKNTVVTSLSTMDVTTFTTVYYAASYTESVGWNVHYFDTPFAWDQASNILIEVCFNNTGYTNNAVVQMTTGLAFNASLWYNADVGTVCSSSSVSAGTKTQRPNIKLGYGYQYTWSNAATTQDISGLAASTYNVTVNAGNSCSTIKSYTITEPTLLVADAGFGLSKCEDFNSFLVGGSPTASGGTTPYTYFWIDGGASLDQTNVANPSANPSTAGSYNLNLTVTDINSCVSSDVVNINIFSNPVISTNYVTSPLCYGDNNGVIDLFTSGGTPTYNYLWDINAGSQTSATATGLVAGSYSVTVTDSNGCIDDYTEVLVDPISLAVSADIVSSVSCNGYSDGAVTANPSGGISPYSYYWDDGVPTVTKDLNSIGAGTYIVTVTDVNGCTISNFVTISEPTVLSLILNSFDENCFNSSDGYIQASPSGGVSGYIYNWNDPLFQISSTATGLTVGTYDVTVADANGCSISDFGTINQVIAMSGAYTIGGTSPDYATINDAINDLMCKGISTSVTFNIRDGVYNEQVSINSISGSSPSSPVIFQSESLDSTLVEVTNVANVANNYTWDFNGASYINLNKIGLTGTDATYGSVVQIRGNSSNISITNCALAGVSVASSTTNHSLIISPNTREDSIYIVQNRLVDGSMGIYLDGQTANNETGTYLGDNVLINQYSRSIHLGKQDASIVENNSIETNSSYVINYGIFHSSVINDFKILSNSITNSVSAGGRGIQLATCTSTIGLKGLVANNMIINNGNGCIELSNASYIQLFHNTGNNISSSATKQALKIATGSNNEVVNNIFIALNGAMVLDISSTSIATFDNNNLFTSGGTFGNYDATPETSFSNWQATVSPFDINSKSVDPLFVSSTNLHLTPTSPVVLYTGAPLSSTVTFDIDGKRRNSTSPWMGASEHSATFYWVNDGGSWSNPSKWAASSNGGDYHNTSPFEGDDVIFDANSFTGSGQVITLPAGEWYMNSIDFQDPNTVPSIVGSGQLIIGPQ